MQREKNDRKFLFMGFSFFLLNLHTSDTVFLFSFVHFPAFLPFQVADLNSRLMIIQMVSFFINIHRGKARPSPPSPKAWVEFKCYIYKRERKAIFFNLIKAFDASLKSNIFFLYTSRRLEVHCEPTKRQGWVHPVCVRHLLLQVHSTQYIQLVYVNDL